MGPVFRGDALRYSDKCRRCFGRNTKTSKESRLCLDCDFSDVDYREFG